MLDLIIRAAMVAFFVYAIHCGVNLFLHFMTIHSEPEKTCECELRGERRELYSSVVRPYMKAHNRKLNSKNIEFYQSVYECLQEEMKQRQNSQYGLKIEFEYEIARMEKQCTVTNDIMSYMATVTSIVGVFMGFVSSGPSFLKTYFTIILCIPLGMSIVSVVNHRKNEEKDHQRAICVRVLEQLKSEMTE